MIARRYSYTLIIVVLVVVALIILRMQLPSMVKDYLNGKLADMGDYQGEIANVDIHLWRGAYSVHQLEITKKDQASVEFFKAKTIDTSVSWASLLKGKVVADVDLINAELHLVDDFFNDKSEEESTWRQKIEEMMPLKIDRLNIINSEIHYHKFASEPPVHIVFYEIDGEITDLSNFNSNESIQYANFALQGLLFDTAKVNLSGHLDPLGNLNNYEVNLKITNIDLTRLNEVSEAYGNFSFDSGNADLVVDLEAGNAQLTGSIEQLKINKMDQTSAPFFQAETIDISLTKEALLEGVIIANIDLIDAELHLVDDVLEDKSNEESKWRQAIQDMVPVRIEQLNITNSEIHFHNFTSEPPIHLAFYQIDGEISDLSNTNRGDGLQYANYDLEGLIFDTATVNLSGQLAPLGEFHNFEINLKIIGVDLTRLNKLAEAYANFNFESGTGDLVMELQADNAQLTGYAKPVFDHVEIFDLDQALQKGVLNAAWEAIVGVFAEIFRNDPKNRIATQIEIRGNLNDPEISAWQAFLAILENAFVNAFESNYGREINTELHTPQDNTPVSDPGSVNKSDPVPGAEYESEAINCTISPIWEPCD